MGLKELLKQGATKEFMEEYDNLDIKDFVKAALEMAISPNTVITNLPKMAAMLVKGQGLLVRDFAQNNLAYDMENTNGESSEKPELNFFQYVMESEPEEDFFEKLAEQMKDEEFQEKNNPEINNEMMASLYYTFLVNTLEKGRQEQNFKTFGEIAEAYQRGDMNEVYKLYGNLLVSNNPDLILSASQMDPELYGNLSAIHEGIDQMQSLLGQGDNTIEQENGNEATEEQSEEKEQTEENNEEFFGKIEEKIDEIFQEKEEQQEQQEGLENEKEQESVEQEGEVAQEEVKPEGEVFSPEEPAQPEGEVAQENEEQQEEQQQQQAVETDPYSDLEKRIESLEKKITKLIEVLERLEVLLEAKQQQAEEPVKEETEEQQEPQAEEESDKDGRAVYEKDGVDAEQPEIEIAGGLDPEETERSEHGEEYEEAEEEVTEEEIDNAENINEDREEKTESGTISIVVNIQNEVTGNVANYIQGDRESQAAREENEAEKEDSTRPHPHYIDEDQQEH